MSLYDSVFDNDPSYGGTQLLMLGPKGSKKSTILRRMAREALKRGEIVIWRAKDVDNWSVFLATGEVNLIVPGTETEVTHVPIYDEKPKLQSVLVQEVNNPESVLNVLDKDKINVIVTSGVQPHIEAAWWTLLWHTLIKRQDNRWISMFIDEIDEIYPAYPDDDWWHIVNMAVNYFVSFRKTNVNLRATCHDPADLNAHLRQKIKHIAYLRGSRLVTGTPLKKGMTGNLEMDNMILTSGGEFEKIKFPKTDKRLLPYYLDKVSNRFNFDPYSSMEYLNILDLEPYVHATCQNPECGYEWQSRNTDPPYCPRCKSMQWVGDHRERVDPPALVALGKKPLRFK